MGRATKASQLGFTSSPAKIRAFMLLVAAASTELHKRLQSVSMSKQLFADNLRYPACRSESLLTLLSCSLDFVSKINTVVNLKRPPPH